MLGACFPLGWHCVRVIARSFNVCCVLCVCVCVCVCVCWCVMVDARWTSGSVPL